jgi:hypothetical protein
MDPLLATVIGEEAHNRFPAFVCEQKKPPLHAGVPVAPLKCKRRHAYPSVAVGRVLAFKARQQFNIAW